MLDLMEKSDVTGVQQSAQNQTGVPYLTIRDLTKRFGEFVALDSIDLEIFEGEFVCFLGPSGCGKTTLLRAIAGLDIQNEGSIDQAGRDVSVLPPAERDFGIVFQSYALFPNLTIHKNIAYGLENKGTGRRDIDDKVAGLLELVGLSAQAQKYPAQLSGGQQQRVALARAIATRPGLLLLDEPLSALDAKVRGHLRHEIKELQRKLGVTTIMVTHDQEEALTMADRIVVMNHGVIEQVGTPFDIYRNPASPFVADFIGTMNFVPGTLQDSHRVDMQGVALACDPEKIYSDGQEVLVAFRPEDLVVCERDERENCFAATILGMEFLGSFYRADLEIVTGQGRFVVRADFSINLIRREALGVGQEIHVALRTGVISVYPAPQAGEQG
ncbi:putative 2-aminoethylphosphonate ABC transporter ATP-binding protein [Kiloniella sp. b19]|uniref:putative 2-aminoethylphosphonate ABC transporter ATP-binding protein n=1 Tax=Kiloniella sp. GXU_MW_B19 TaxID=3141326 RepID=UPI0031CEFE2D